MERGGPFIYGKLANTNTFANRTAEIEQLTTNFKGGINTILISPRRWGKSSLVEETSRRIQSKTIKVASMDLFDVNSESEFYSLLANEVFKACSSKTEELLDYVKRFFSQLIPKLSFQAVENQTVNLEFDWEQAQKHPEEILDLAEKIAATKNIQLIICIDEFQNISNFKNPMAFQKKLRAHWQRHAHVSYCLYGSKRSMLIEVFSSANMPFYKFGDIILLEKIAGKEWEKFIVRRFKSTGKSIPTPTARLIHEYTERHSYYVQQLAQQCWLRTADVCTPEIVEDALESLMHQLSLLFQTITDQLPTSQIYFLRALLDGQTALSSKKVLAKYRLGTSGNIKRIKAALQQKEIIDIMGKEIMILDPMYKHWLRKLYFR